MAIDHNNRFRVPIPPRIINLSENSEVTLTECEEIYYDHNTLTYRTRGQSLEIDRLKKELEDKKTKRDDSLKALIGYFYKR